MVQRRERGEGSLTYDRNANRWVGRLDLGVDQNGRRQRLKVTGRTRTEARSRLDALHADHQAGLEVTDRAVTFEQLATLWLTRGLPTDTAETTRQNYEAIVRVHLLPSLGPKRVGDLRPNDLEKLLDAMATAGYSGRTLRLTLTLARRLLRLGQRRGLVARNVAEVVQAPRGPVRERHGLTPDQARALLAAAQQDRLGGLITVSLLLGLRPGEAAGLTWDAVDLDADPPTLRVERSLRRSRSGMILSPPKTPTSRRVVALPPGLRRRPGPPAPDTRRRPVDSRTTLAQPQRPGVHHRHRHPAGSLERTTPAPTRRRPRRPRPPTPPPAPARRRQPALRRRRAPRTDLRPARTPLHHRHRRGVPTPTQPRPLRPPRRHSRTHQNTHRQRAHRLRVPVGCPSRRYRISGPTRCGQSVEFLGFLPARYPATSVRDGSAARDPSLRGAPIPPLPQRNFASRGGPHAGERLKGGRWS